MSQGACEASFFDSNDTCALLASTKKEAQYIKIQRNITHQKIKTVLIQSSVSPIDSKGFVKFLGRLFSSSFPLEIVLKGILNLRGTDENNIMVEMIKHSSISFKERLLHLLNQTLSKGSSDES